MANTAARPGCYRVHTRLGTTYILPPVPRIIPTDPNWFIFASCSNICGHKQNNMLWLPASTSMCMSSDQHVHVLIPAWACPLTSMSDKWSNRDKYLCAPCLRGDPLCVRKTVLRPGFSEISLFWQYINQPLFREMHLNSEQLSSGLFLTRIFLEEWS